MTYFYIFLKIFDFVFKNTFYFSFQVWLALNDINYSKSKIPLLKFGNTCYWLWENMLPCFGSRDMRGVLEGILECILEPVDWVFSLPWVSISKVKRKRICESLVSVDWSREHLIHINVWDGNVWDEKFICIFCLYRFVDFSDSILLIDICSMCIF